MKLEFPGAVPEIPVRDINEAAAYYENDLKCGETCLRSSWDLRRGLSLAGA
jgi:hypothetical protein